MPSSAGVGVSRRKAANFLAEFGWLPKVEAPQSLEDRLRGGASRQEVLPCGQALRRYGRIAGL